MEVGFITFLVVVITQGLVVSLLFKFFRLDKKWKIIGPAQMWKSTKGLGVLDDLAHRWPGFWRAFGGFGIILGFGFLGGLWVFRKRHVVSRVVLSIVSSSFLAFPLFSFGYSPIMSFSFFLIGYGPTLALFSIYSGFEILFKLLLGQQVYAKAGPLIPGVDIKGSPYKGIPWYGWLALPVLLIVHEASHGVIARLGKIKVKSAGVIIMGLLPLGAFVEPDDKQLEKAKVEKTLPLYAAGSTANYLTALSIFVLLFWCVSPLLAFTGVSGELDKYRTPPVVVASQNPDVPIGVTVYTINGIPVKTSDDVRNITHSLPPSARVNLTTSSGLIETKLNNNLIGVYFSYDFQNLPLHLEILDFVVELLGLTAFFNLVVGVMNLLPLLPLDGGLMMRDFLVKVFRLRHGNEIAVIVSVVVGVGLLLNLLPVLLQGF